MIWCIDCVFDDSVTLSDPLPEILPFLPGDFGGEVRFTDDGRVSVYDAIGFTTGHKNPRDVWKSLTESHTEVVGKADNFQFPGQGQRPTPVASLQVFLEILVTLPGKIAAAVREQAVGTLVRAMQGDPSLAQEIIERIHRPHDLAKDLCDVLELSNPSQAISRLDDDEKDVIISNDSVGRKQDMVIVSEPGMYVSD